MDDQKCPIPLTVFCNYLRKYIIKIADCLKKDNKEEGKYHIL